jgi:ABC-type antimicrobial peptide transport system permease subunit
MQSLLGASPTVFLRQAEDCQGQVDCIIRRKDRMGGLNFSAIYVNVETSGEDQILSHMSPRFDISNNANLFTVNKEEDSAGSRSFMSKGYVLGVDTARDIKAGIGRSWELPPLSMGETWISRSIASALSIEKGDSIDIELNVYDILSKYVTLNDSVTELYSRSYIQKKKDKYGNITKTVKNACVGYADKSGTKPRIDDAVLVGTKSAKCNPGSRQTMFCGNVRDGSRCGMSPNIMFRLKVADVIKSWHGRLPSSTTSAEDEEGAAAAAAAEGAQGSKDTMVVVEIPHIMEMIMKALPTKVRDTLQPVIDERTAGSASESMVKMSYDSVTEVFVNLPTDIRNSILLQDDYVSIQDDVVQYSGRVLSSIGAIWLDVQNPILQYLRGQRFTTLYLGMVMDILIAILLGLSSVLIYSLMMINVQGRQFELAVRRMLGATKVQVIALLGVQSMSFAIPSVVFGLPLAHALTEYLFTGFNQIAGVTIVGGLSVTGATYGIVLGIFIPVFGAIGPIRSALGVELRESLDVTRSKTKVIEYQIESEQDRSRISPEILAVGGSLSVFGFLVYYLLPLALLSLDLRLFFLLFVALLLGMLVGLVLLASNLQGFVEYAVGHLFLFWTKKVLKQLALKNLIAHRKRNWKTSIMYSLSLAFIIFIGKYTIIRMEDIFFLTIFFVRSFFLLLLYYVHSCGLTNGGSNI